MSDKTKTPMELLYEAMKMGNEKSRELDLLNERRRTLNAELVQVEDKIRFQENQIAGHKAEALRYMGELLKKS